MVQLLMIVGSLASLAGLALAILAFRRSKPSEPPSNSCVYGCPNDCKPGCVILGEASGAAVGQGPDSDDADFCPF
jgi:hypothetical protein